MSVLIFKFADKYHCSYLLNDIDKGLRVHFECIEPYIAHMYFTNANEEYIDVPKEYIRVYRHITNMDKVIQQTTNPLHKQMCNKMRMGYLNTYYLLHKNQEYEICYHSNNNDNGEQISTSLRLVPQQYWEIENHHLVGFKVH